VGPRSCIIGMIRLVAYGVKGPIPDFSFVLFSFCIMLVVFSYVSLGVCIVLGCSFCQYQSSDWLRRLSVLQQSRDWEDDLQKVSSRTLNSAQ